MVGLYVPDFQVFYVDVIWLILTLNLTLNLALTITLTKPYSKLYPNPSKQLLINR